MPQPGHGKLYHLSSYFTCRQVIIGNVTASIPVCPTIIIRIALLHGSGVILCDMPHIHCISLLLIGYFHPIVVLYPFKQFHFICNGNGCLIVFYTLPSLLVCNNPGTVFKLYKGFCKSLVVRFSKPEPVLAETQRVKNRLDQIPVLNIPLRHCIDFIHSCIYPFEALLHLVDIFLVISRHT